MIYVRSGLVFASPAASQSPGEVEVLSERSGKKDLKKRKKGTVSPCHFWARCQKRCRAMEWAPCRARRGVGVEVGVSAMMDHCPEQIHPFSSECVPRPAPASAHHLHCNYQAATGGTAAVTSAWGHRGGSRGLLITFKRLGDILYT